MASDAPAPVTVSTAAEPAVCAADDAAAAASAAPQATPLSTDDANGLAAGDQTPEGVAAIPATGTEAEPAPNPDLERYTAARSKVAGKPDDFPAWEELIKAAEKLNDIERLRDTYNGFLAEWPLCYGYWKKFADAEARHSGVEAATAVFERSVSSVPYSVDLWGAYCTFKQKHDAPVEEVRSLYEKGLAYVGSDYLSHTLWDKLVAYEASRGEHRRVLAAYLRVLACPLRELDRFHTNFQEFCAQRTVAELVTEAELAELRAAVAAEAAEGGAQEAGEPAAPAANGDSAAAPGEDGPAPMATDSGGVAQLSDGQLKAKWLSSHEAVYREAKEEQARRVPYEAGIRRPYFHVKPLDSAQLGSWAGYLDYVEPRGDNAVTIRLYERCLVACALYPEFWMRYIRYLEDRNVDSARGALQRAVLVHCKRRPEMHLFAAHFEERHGNVEAARASFEAIEQTVAPGLVEAIVQHANFERRQGQPAAARAVYDAAVAAAAAKQGSAAQVAHAHLVIQYARLLSGPLGDLDAARAVYEAALASAPQLRKLWEGAIHLEEMLPGQRQAERVLALYERATAPPQAGDDGAAPASLAERDREELSVRAVAYADLTGDGATLARWQALHAQRFRTPAKVAESRKRAAATSASPPAKQPKVEAPTPAATSAAASAPAAAPAASAPATAAAAAAAAYYHQPAAAGYYGAYPYAPYPGYAPAAYGYGY